MAYICLVLNSIVRNLVCRDLYNELFVYHHIVWLDWWNPCSVRIINGVIFPNSESCETSLLCDMFGIVLEGASIWVAYLTLDCVRLHVCTDVPETFYRAKIWSCFVGVWPLWVSITSCTWLWAAQLRVSVDVCGSFRISIASFIV